MLTKNLLLSILSTAILSSFPFELLPQCGDSSNTHSFTYGGNSYDIIKTTHTWMDAADCAVQKGGHLVHINDQAEQDTLYQRILNEANVSPSYTSVSDGGGAAYVWIGANDMANEGTWVWDGNGDSTGIEFWNGEGSAGSGGGSAVNNAFYYWGGTSSGSPKEPDDYQGSQNAAGIALQNWPNGIASEWNDINASNPLYFVVEYENTTSLKTPSEKGREDLKIHPNPVESKILWESSDDSFNYYRILDTSGRIVLEGSLEAPKKNGSIEASDIDPGIYFLEIGNKKGNSHAKRFLKR